MPNRSGLYTMKAPHIKPEILDWLEKVFPDKLAADKLDDPRDYDVAVGQQFVVRRVRREVARQSEDLHDVT